MTMRPLVPSLLPLLASAAVAAQPADDHWLSTPWPITSQGGIELCFLSYENDTRIISVTAMNNGNHFISVSDTAFTGVADGANVSLVFPSGWPAGAPSRSKSPGNLRGPLPEGSPLGQPCIAQFTTK